MLRTLPAFIPAASLAITLAIGGCADGLDRPDRVDQVVLEITAVPAEVTCVRLTATGPARSVERELDTGAGASIAESFSGLPLGTVLFKAEAFTQDCDAVTKTTIPGWASEPVPTSIVLGRLSTVALTLHRNGRAKVNVDFVDEPLCTANGGICLQDSECCSQSCARGACQVGDGGAPDRSID